MTAAASSPEPKNITEALARIMGELPAISKKRHPEGGVNYAFRGIEEITAEAQELCARYGVVYFPRGEITEIKEITVNGKPWTDTIVSVEYEVSHGPSDTSKIVRVPGIGRDNSDKGSNKGMTQAFKYALIQTLMIADPKDDGDRERHETDGRLPQGASVPRPQSAASGAKTYLEVPFKDKDEIKALGARWDKDRKAWYIDGSADKEKFAKWLSDEPEGDAGGEVPEWKTLGYEDEADLLGAIDIITNAWKRIEDEAAKEGLKGWLRDRDYAARWPVKESDYQDYIKQLNAFAGPKPKPEYSAEDEGRPF